jgi:hypothetical protein
MQTPCGEMIDVLSCKSENEISIIIDDLLNNKIKSQSVEFKKKILNIFKTLKNNQIAKTKDQTLLDNYNKILEFIDNKKKDL